MDNSNNMISAPNNPMEYIELELEWSSQQHRYSSFWAMLEIFKDKQLSKDQIKILTDRIFELREQQQELSRLEPDLEWRQIFQELAENKIQKHLVKIKAYRAALKPKKAGAINIQDQINKAKLVPLTELYEGKLRKSGRLLIGKCPLHSERTGSFMIYIDQNTWYCYGCNEGGDPIDFIQKSKNCEWIEALRSLTI